MKFTTAVIAATLLAGPVLAQTTLTPRPAQGNTMGTTTTGTISADPSANVRESRSYADLVKENPGFRNARAMKECSPIESYDLRQQCVASFTNPAPIRAPDSVSGNAGQVTTGVGAGQRTVIYSNSNTFGEGGAEGAAVQTGN